MSARGGAVNKTIGASELEYSVVSLLPGICYICSLSASTKLGYGPASTRLVWTRPDGTSLPIHLIAQLIKSS